jgi:hypothetical protein
MLVDVVYPGFAPCPNLGVADDVPGYIQAHRDALACDFTDFVGGHVDGLGSRSDVELSLQFALALERTAEEVLAGPSSRRGSPTTIMRTSESVAATASWPRRGNRACKASSDLCARIAAP